MTLTFYGSRPFFHKIIHNSQLKTLFLCKFRWLLGFFNRFTLTFRHFKPGCFFHKLFSLNKNRVEWRVEKERGRMKIIKGIRWNFHHKLLSNYNKLQQQRHSFQVKGKTEIKGKRRNEKLVFPFFVLFFFAPAWSLSLECS